MTPSVEKGYMLNLITDPEQFDDERHKLWLHTDQISTPNKHEEFEPISPEKHG